MTSIVSPSWVTRGIIVLAFAGMLASGVLLANHDGGWRTAGASGTGYLLNLCHPPSMPSASCAKVVGSRWGALDLQVGPRRWEVPLSFLGFAYFVTMAVWFTFTGASRDRSWPRRCFPLAAGILGLVASCGLIGIMAFAIRSWCPLCVIAHAANFGMVTLILIQVRRDRAEPGEVVGFSGRRADGGVPAHLARLAVLTSLCAVAGGWMLFDRTIELRRQWRKAHGLRQAIDSLQEDETLMLYTFLAEPVQQIPAGANGNLVSPPRIVLFLDPDSRASACFESAWRERYARAVGDALPVEYRQLTGDADRALAATFDVRQAPAAVVDGRRVPDLCLRSDAFWAVVGRQPAPQGQAADPVVLLSEHAAARPGGSEVRLP